VIVVDTGVIYAAADRAEADHQVSQQLVETHPGPLLVPTPLIVEAAWLIESRLGLAPKSRSCARSAPVT